MSALAGVRAGDQYLIVGLPGEEGKHPAPSLTIDSTTNTGQLNCSLMADVGEDWHLVTIGAADLAASIEAGWIIKARS